MSRYDKARQRVIFLLEQNNYDDGEDAANALTELFGSNQQMPDTLYGVVQRYEWAKRFEQAKRIYGQLIEKYPNSIFAQKAKIGLARVDVLSLIASEKFSEASGALDKLATDFSGNPDLPETLFQVSERYKWLSKFDEQKSICRRIIQNHPDSPYSSKAKVTIAGADAMSYVMSQDFGRAKTAINQMIADFNDNQDLPEVLYLVAERCEWVSRYNEAKGVYQKIVRNYPDCSYAGKANLRAGMADVMTAINSLDYNQADKNLDKFIADFNGNPDLQFAALLVGEKYYRERKTPDSVERAKRVFKIITEKLPVSIVTPEACCGVGDCCTELGQFKEAISYYTRSSDGFPQFGCEPNSHSDYDFRWRSLYMTGQSYQKLIQSGDITIAEATPLMVAAYERVVTDFANCALAKDAWRELGKTYIGKNSWRNAIRCYEAYLRVVPEGRASPEVYYQLAKAYDRMGNIDLTKKNYKQFVRMAMPDDPRRKEATDRLAELP